MARATYIEVRVDERGERPRVRPMIVTGCCGARFYAEHPYVTADGRTFCPTCDETIDLSGACIPKEREIVRTFGPATRRLVF